VIEPESILRSRTDYALAKPSRQASMVRVAAVLSHASGLPGVARRLSFVIASIILRWSAPEPGGDCHVTLVRAASCRAPTSSLSQSPTSFSPSWAITEDGLVMLMMLVTAARALFDKPCDHPDGSVLARYIFLVAAPAILAYSPHLRL
jgi:hypothetical protein